MSGRYFVRLYVKTLSSIAESRDQYKAGARPVWAFTWTTDDVRLVLYDQLRDEDGVSVHEGLGLDLDVPANGLDEAIEKARNLAEGLVNLISYVTAAACSPAAVVSSHRIPESKSDTEVAWVLQETRAPLGDLKPIDSDRLGSAYSLYDKAAEERKWRISQAAQWLRKGLLELETVGQFIAYWVGLESAASVFGEILSHEQKDVFPTCANSKCKHEIRECPECGKSLGRPNQMASVSEVFVQYFDDGKKTYNRLRTLRGKLFHGGGKLKPRFLEDLRAAIPVARRALAIAIGLMLGIDEAELRKISESRPRRSVRPRRVRVLGKLVQFDAPPTARAGSAAFCGRRA